jgi:hypothetical protein
LKELCSSLEHSLPHTSAIYIPRAMLMPRP